MSNQENNKMIAEFMGLELEETLEGLFVYARKEQSPIKLNDIRIEFYEVHELQYHLSWDWLMPVVVECFEIFGNTDAINYTKLNDALLTCNIDELYRAVVELINQYNKNK